MTFVMSTDLWIVYGQHLQHEHLPAALDDRHYIKTG